MKNKHDFSVPLPRLFIREYSKNVLEGASISKAISSNSRAYFSTLLRRRKKFKPSQI